MFEDFRRRDDGTVIDADICIIGAGAAGITMALELAGSRRKVCLIESGSFEPEPETLALNRGTSVGQPYPPLEVVRLRYFGGTTNHWGGHCRPLDAIDFEERPWIPYSGWPIDRADLEPWYQRAHDICELGPYEYDPDRWRPHLPAVIDFDPQRLVNRTWLLSPPTRFGQRYRADLERAPNLHVVLNANVVEIVTDETARTVTALRLRTLEGKTGTVRPNVVVLACGGIENPRLLLASRGAMSSGLGNANDLVGRFFMEHPDSLIGYAVASQDVQRWVTYGRHMPVSLPSGKALVRMGAGLNEALQRKEGLLNCYMNIGWGHVRSPGYLALRDVGKKLGSGQIPDDLGDALLTMLGDLGGITEGVYRRLMAEDVFWLGTNVEQAPNPDSRVTLGDERDAMGLPQVRLDWRLTTLEKRTTRYVCWLLAQELARLGLARTRIAPWLVEDDTSWPVLDIRYHHMGTTRMSNDPAHGVVDANCRVHGIQNLYVSGSSVFPTGGCSNPTMTIVALAARLAEHLKQSHVKAG
jgi:choline dehydrogenase-like flavoprotein